MNRLNRALRKMSDTEYAVIVDGEIHAHILYTDQGHGARWYATDSTHTRFSLYAFDNPTETGEYATFEHVRRTLGEIALSDLSLDDLKALLRAQEWEHTYLSQQDGIGVNAQLQRFSRKYIEPVRAEVKTRQEQA